MRLADAIFSLEGLSTDIAVEDSVFGVRHSPQVRTSSTSPAVDITERLNNFGIRTGNVRTSRPARVPAAVAAGAGRILKLTGLFSTQKPTTPVVPGRPESRANPPGEDPASPAGWYARNDQVQQWWTGEWWQDAWRRSDGVKDAAARCGHAILSTDLLTAGSPDKQLLKKLRRFPPARIVSLSAYVGALGPGETNVALTEWDQANGNRTVPAR